MATAQVKGKLTNQPDNQNYRQKARYTGVLLPGVNNWMWFETDSIIHDDDGRFIAQGFYNLRPIYIDIDASKIIGRIYSDHYFK